MTKRATPCKKTTKWQELTDFQKLALPACSIISVLRKTMHYYIFPFKIKLTQASKLGWHITSLYLDFGAANMGMVVHLKQHLRNR